MALFRRRKDTPEPAAGEPGPAQRRGWLGRLRDGLGKSSSRLAEGIGGLVGGGRRRLDDATLEALEDVLITADLGPSPAARLVAELGARRFDQELSEADIRAEFAADIGAILEPVARPLAVDPAHRPHVVLVVGVNGSGKTTTIGKLARNHRDAGLSVMMAAGDTFRAAAIDQLKIWAERTDSAILARDPGADAAGLAFDALKQARDSGLDLLLIDTAGRLQNKKELMDELAKIVRVLRKIDDSAPHDVLLVLDATVGQNAHSQVEAFRDMAEVTGLIVTKLDGTARGGVVVSLAEKFGLPVHAVGVGESAEDMRPFAAQDYARSLMGLDPAGDSAADGNREQAA
ncbi:MAG: signal recognition particle-docking protein FtsY [Rhodospirillaceae bacterium]|nr:signal recognition particle-docking protein FtsY [Rhodospirillaceae bacterium]